MISTHLDRTENVKHSDEEPDRPRRDVWLALGMILAILLAVLIGLWIAVDGAPSTALLSFV